MRLDPAYTDMLTHHDMRNGTTIIDQDPEAEFTKYVNNKLMEYVELTKLDAILFGIHYDRNVIIWDVKEMDVSNAVLAPECHYPDDGVIRDTWVFFHNVTILHTGQFTYPVHSFIICDHM